MNVPSILQKITNQRRDAVKMLATQPHYDEVRLLEHIRRYGRPIRSLAKALRAADKGFVLECKKASPSKGLIRENFDPVAIARIYQGYAAAISVLTEADFFQGDFAYLQAVSAQVQIPVVCKDFIVEPLHVYLARYYGADAILLMLSILDDEQYRTLAALASTLGLEVLTEVSTPAEMRRASELGAVIIGINHRNLHDLSIDLSRSRELAALAPAGALLVAESGIESNQQAREIGRYVNGFLVGSHLTGQADIDAACRRLIFGAHKVCGLTRAADARAAAAAGATYGGLIFADHSPRRVSIATAQQICAEVSELAYVAVVTTDNISAVLNVAEQLPLAAVQLHGQQGLEFAVQLREKLSDEVEIWYALNMSAPDSVEQLQQLLATQVEKIQLDQGNGGSGSPFDWTLLDSLTRAERQRCMLAGGLTPDNITPAAAIGCSGLDMNSGVEAAPGIKDPALLQKCFTLLASYYRDAGVQPHRTTVSTKEIAS